MSSTVESIKLLSSAVEAGKKAALEGRVDNPFDKKHELLRVAFHIGWVMEHDETKSYSEEHLLKILVHHQPTICVGVPETDVVA